MSAQQPADLGIGRRLLAVLAAIILMGAWPAVALEPDDLCLEALPARPVLARDLVNETYIPEVSRLEPSLPFRLRESGSVFMLTDIETGAEAELEPPTWDEGWMPLGYDEANQVLYLRTYDDLAWVRLDRSGGRLRVLASDVIRPWLRRYDDGMGGSRMAEPRFSHALGRLFVSGYGGSWRPFYPHGFHSFEVVGGEVRPVSEVDGRVLTYLGDDPVARAAVLADGEGHHFHYDGRTLTPTERPLLFWRNDPLSEGVLLRDDEGRPWQWAGEVLTELDPGHVLAGEVGYLLYRSSFGRWVMVSATEDAWFLYDATGPIERLDMPPEAARSWSWLVIVPEGLSTLLANSDSLWLETEGGAELFARVQNGRKIYGPADTGATADGSAFAFSTVEDGDLFGDRRTWFALNVARPGERCSVPAGWTILGR